MGGEKSKKLRQSVFKTQNLLFSKNIPFVLIFEGPGGEIGSRIVNKFIAALEPRGVEFHYYVPDEGLNFNTATQLFKDIPAKGRLGIYDRGWYSYFLDRKCSKKESLTELNAIMYFEQYLADNGVMLLKFFLNLDDDVIRKYTKDYVGYEIPESKLFKNYSKVKYNAYSDNISYVLKSTSTPHSPWEVIDVSDPETTMNSIFEKFVSNVDFMLKHPYNCPMHEIKEAFPNPREKANLSEKIDPAEYKKKLPKLQNELSLLQDKLSRSNKSLVLAFEGWDAAGKGGAIKRVTAALNPRGYTVYPIAAPTPEEKAKTHLWRFANRLPKDGNIAIFDRTWYGRMMVEPIEKFCTKSEYSRAGDEINLFEYYMTSHDTILIKFWIEISKDVQLERFNDRKKNPDKCWKITDEDWRNREKWDTYSKYVDSMMKQTNTDFAPWHVIESNDKKFARIKVIQTIISVLRKEL